VRQQDALYHKGGGAVKTMCNCIRWTSGPEGQTDGHHAIWSGDFSLQIK